MDYKLSKLAKEIIILNIVFTIIIVMIHGYNLQKIIVTNNKINQVMEESNVVRITAIQILEEEGEILFLNREVPTYLGGIASILSFVFLYKFAKYNGFYYGFFTAVSCLLTSIVGGLLLFYVIFSGKSQANGKCKAFLPRNEWEKYIHEKVMLSGAAENKM